MIIAIAMITAIAISSAMVGGVVVYTYFQNISAKTASKYYSRECTTARV